eukprot:TRINITY_DN7285_c0_g2_i1.p1 TRINITY_DN7285_c0_g2~~TRINITY_DN7285_c0_g2_i1.p1  ORF type:complete len:241 (-),score=67.85 TRINITY_DN7285_c0_g2_i1:204-830(-)
MATEQMPLSLLPVAITAARVSRENGKVFKCAQSIMFLLLFPRKADRFFCFTETDNEISLLLDESSLSLFPKKHMTLSKHKYRAVSVGIGSSVQGGVALVSSLLNALSIPMQAISTFDNDYVLIPESFLPQAIQVLQKKFSIDSDDLAPASTIIDTPATGGDLQGDDANDSSSGVSPAPEESTIANSFSLFRRKITLTRYSGAALLGNR